MHFVVGDDVEHVADADEPAGRREMQWPTWLCGRVEVELAQLRDEIVSAGSSAARVIVEACSRLDSTARLREPAAAQHGYLVCGSNEDLHERRTCSLKLAPRCPRGGSPRNRRLEPGRGFLECRRLLRP